MEQPYGLGVQILGALWFTRAATRLYLDNCEDIVRNMLNFSAYTRNGRGSVWWGGAACGRRGRLWWGACMDVVPHHYFFVIIIDIVITTTSIVEEYLGG